MGMAGTGSKQDGVCTIVEMRLHFPKLCLSDSNHCQPRYYMIIKKRSCSHDKLFRTREPGIAKQRMWYHLISIQGSRFETSTLVKKRKYIHFIYILCCNFITNIVSFGMHEGLNQCRCRRKRLPKGRCAIWKSNFGHLSLLPYQTTKPTTKKIAIRPEYRQNNKCCCGNGQRFIANSRKNIANFGIIDSSGLYCCCLQQIGRDVVLSLKSQWKAGDLTKRMGKFWLNCKIFGSFLSITNRTRRAAILCLSLKNSKIPKETCNTETENFKIFKNFLKK